MNHVQRIKRGMLIKHFRSLISFGKDTLVIVKITDMNRKVAGWLGLFNTAQHRTEIV